MTKRVFLDCAHCGCIKAEEILDMNHSKMTLCYSCLADYANGAEI